MNIDDTKPRVRLSARKIEVIHATVSRLLGGHACIRIFGSRAREDEKGGNIDILIETEQQLPSRVASACRLASELQMQLAACRTLGADFIRCA